jgi:GNAT superfamily N-acetyltransferase
MASVLAKMSARVAERGWRGAAAKLVADHVFRLSTSVILECRADWLRVARPDARAYRFVLCRDGDALPPLCAWLAHRARAFGAMLAEGKVGLFMLRDGVAVGCAWLALSDHHDREAREFYAVAPGEAYHYCWLVDPAERSRGGGLALARYALTQIREMGVSRSFGVVDRVNRASYRVLSHMGYREAGVKVHHLYLLHRRFTWTRPYRGTLGLSDDRRGRARA